MHVFLSEGISVQRYEWSAGTQGNEPGNGIFDPAHDRIWYDVGLETYAIVLQESEWTHSQILVIISSNH